MEAQYDYGMIGIGTMGRNLVYNMCDHGYAVAGFDKDNKQVYTFKKEAGERKVFGTTNLNDFVQAIKSPRVIMLLVPAGPIVDAVIEELKPLLSAFDLIMDCGNSHFTDTDRRIASLAKVNLHFMGVGISGGEAGARSGPSIMPGGGKDIYGRIAPMLESISAKVNSEPCATYLGPGSAGHYVKMVHNGIEYGLMQLISEVYQLLKEGAGFSNDELRRLFLKWNEGRLQSFLVEITAVIFAQKDDLTNNDLVDMIADTAAQKGTGKWTSQSAMDMGTPIPLIDTAVAMRELSAFKQEREKASEQLKGPEHHVKLSKDELIVALEQALYFSMITVYAQGMSLLHHASHDLAYNLKLADVAAIWRGGCIIRAGLLENIRLAYDKKAELANMMMDDFFAGELAATQTGIRKVVQIGVEAGIPVAAMMSALSYYDAYRHNWLPANLIQAQRDYFGAHTYVRIDRTGNFHTNWNQQP